MEKVLQLVPIKFIVNSTMKAKLKATAALNDMTIGDLFMDAVLEKYPFLINSPTNENKLQIELYGIAKQLKNTNQQKPNINRLEKI